MLSDKSHHLLVSSLHCHSIFILQMCIYGQPAGVMCYQTSWSCRPSVVETLPLCSGVSVDWWVGLQVQLVRLTPDSLPAQQKLKLLTAEVRERRQRVLELCDSGFIGGATVLLLFTVWECVGLWVRHLDTSCVVVVQLCRFRFLQTICGQI